jgi:tetratricopeptide (TPR) repeat protein
LNNHNFIEYEPDAETVDLIRRYENAVQKRSKDYFDEEEFEAIIDHYLNINKSVEAITAVDRASKQYPYSTDLKLRHADILIVKGDASRALQILQTAEQMDGCSGDVLFLKGRAYVKLGNFNAANECFEKGWQAEDDDEEREWKCFISAGDWIDVKEYKLAIHCFKKIIDNNPEHEQALNDIAYCYDRLGDSQTAIQYYNDCIAVNPFSDAAWYNLGNVHNSHERYEEALQAFDFAIAVNPQNSSALYNRAATLIELERFSDAIESFKEYMQFDINNAQALCAIAECYENINAPAKALKYYMSAIKIDPECADAYYGKGLIMIDRTHYDAALECLHRAICIKPKAEYFYGMGVLMLRINADDVALMAFRRSAELDPYDIESWLIVSELVGSTDLRGALGVLDEAHVHNPHKVVVFFRKAALYYILKDKKSCLASLEQALKLSGETDSDDFLTICPEAVKDKRIKALYARYKNNDISTTSES